MDNYLFQRLNHIMNSNLEYEIDIVNYYNSSDNEERCCPVCSQYFNVRNYGFHILQDHPALFSVILSTYLNPILETNLDTTNLEELDVMEDEDFDYYNYYSNLCEMIGYETIGITDIDKYVPVIEQPESDLKCPICLETFEENKRTFRRTKLCKHEFCNECSITWFGKHKKCPVCIQEVQMAERSISESPSANSIASSPLSPSSIPST